MSAELSLFDAVNVPDIRAEAPSAPGSRTSKLAALAMRGPMRSRCYRKILFALGSMDHPISREQLSDVTGIKESTLCGRLDELCNVFGPNKGWVEAVDGACRSRAGMTVNGYALTPAGRARITESEEAA